MKNKLLFLGFICTLTFWIGCCTAGYHEASVYFEQENIKSFVYKLSDYTIALTDADQYPDNFDTICSGVWINETTILTARHCIENKDGTITYSKILKFKTFDQFGKDLEFKDLHSATVKGFSKNKDFALLSSIERIEHGYVKLYKGDVFTGMNVYLMGHPIGQEYSFMDGLVSQIRTKTFSGMTHKLLHVTSLANSGNSGCGIFTENGELVGLLSFQSSKVAGMKYAIHRDEIIIFFEDENISY